MIRGMKPIDITDFTGKDTTTNLSKQALGTLIAAENALILADRNVRRAPGYTKVFEDASFPTDAGAIVSMFDFQRSVDQAQFLFVQRGKKLWASRVTAGAFGAPVLITTLAAADPLLYTPSTFNCYASNGTDAIRLVDDSTGPVAGMPTAFRWGILQPATLPTVQIQTPPNTGLVYAWDFGDGGTSTTSSPTHTYGADGTYTVTLTVTNTAGNSVSSKTTVVVGIPADQPTSLPGGPYRGTTNHAVVFDGTKSLAFFGSGSGIPSDESRTYAWDFGDGGSGSGSPVSYAYTAPGLYDVSLTVTNSLGNSTSAVTSVLITDPISTSIAAIPTQSSSAVAGTPVARPSGPYSGSVGIAVSFNGTNSSDPNGLGISYLWDFGDGITATTASPTHIYATPGRYTVSLKVTNTAGLYSLVQTTSYVSNSTPVADPGGAQYVASGSLVTFDGTYSSNYTGLDLEYGRSYVVAYVSRYTDTLGIPRIHVGPPTQIADSMYTGPISNKVVSVTPAYAFLPSPEVDPQVSNVWIFGTKDAPKATSATYYFIGEVGRAGSPIVGWAAFKDSFGDEIFDLTQLAPFGNYPAPKSICSARFQSRIFTLAGNLLQYSGGPTVTLGIPDEAFPPDAFFPIPAGSRLPNAIAVLNEGNTLGVSNGDYWFKFSGYDASSFTESDKVVSPGQAGPWAGVNTPFGWAYFSPSKRLWLWNGQSTQSLELSAELENTLIGCPGMDSIDETFIKFARAHWYSYGARHFLAGIVRSVNADDTPTAPTTAPSLDWMNIWGVPSQGIGSANALYATDKFLSDYATCTCDLLLGGVPSILLATPAAGIMKFPSGYADNGVMYRSAFSHAWIMPLNGASRYYWVDFFVDVSDPDAALALGGPEEFMRVSARVLEAAEDTTYGTHATVLSLVRIPKPREENESAFAVRASLQVPSTSSGRFIRLNFTLAPGQTAFNVDFDVAVQKIVLQSAPVFAGAP